MEGAGQVLARGQVYSGLAADSAVGLPQQRGGQAEQGMPRMYMAAANPAASVTAPPPRAAKAESRPRPSRISRFKMPDTAAQVLAFPPRGRR
jgi:hypothetical protein